MIRMASIVSADAGIWHNHQLWTRFTWASIYSKIGECSLITCYFYFLFLFIFFYLLNCRLGACKFVFHCKVYTCSIRHMWQIKLDLNSQKEKERFLLKAIRVTWQRLLDCKGNPLLIPVKWNDPGLSRRTRGRGERGIPTWAHLVAVWRGKTVKGKKQDKEHNYGVFPHIEYMTGTI